MTYQTTILATVVALFFIGAATVVGVTLSGNAEALQTPMLVTILTGIATTVAALVAVLRADRVSEKVDQVETKAEAIERRINGDPPPSPHP